ncbi:MAG: hypothetical protein IJC88_02250 [Oscillospiraceae bacterium]|nr:hypothetical protein [Oscillospiraceae bacterium]
MGNLSELKKLVFESDNNACFIERERILNRLEKEMADYNEPDKYAIILSKLLSEASTPIFDCDYFAGRVVEALPEENMAAPSELLCSVGHMSFDYEKLLKVGLKGILTEIKANAKEKGDFDSVSFAKNAEIVIMAIKNYVQRYANEARNRGLLEMAKALDHVPYEPAYDFFSALQSIWLIHMIASCYVGARDYAFGRFDEYMLPFYEKALKNGKTESELTEILAGFFMKTNEICGRGTHNYKCKPILSQASKQYINIGGENPNVFSSVVLEAAKLNHMAQPQITVLLKPDADEEFTANVFTALSVLTDKMHIYHYSQIVEALINQGIEKEIAKEFTYSACCTFDLNYHSFRLEYFTPVPQIFLSVFHHNEYSSLRELLADFKAALTEEIQNYVNRTQDGFCEEEARKQFVLDSLLLSDSTVECRYACDGKAKYNVLNIFCPGVATIGDSLMVLDKLVFKEMRYSYSEFAEIVKNNYQNHEELLEEIKGYTMFGNDTEIDRYTVLAGNAFLDAVDAVEHRENHYLAAGFYSLERENVWAAEIGATPNGRRKGEPFSENQSPTYGADKNSITALLKSLSKLPFERTVTGGLNLTFSQRISPEILQALVISYFQMGGFHIGISVIDRKTLEDAMVNPNKYKSLTVRLYGFSEYFISLPKWQQIAILNRTEYCV